MRETRLPIATTAAVAAVLLTLACTTLDAAAPPAGKAPWQRLLQGEDARKAADLDKKLAEIQVAGKFEEALKVALALAELRKKVQGEEHWQTVNALHQVSAIRKVLKQNAAGRERHSSIASLQSEADALVKTGRYRDAQPVVEKILAIRRDVLGEEHPDTATSYNDVAYMLDSQGNYVRGEENFRKALAIRRKLLGEEHPDTAQSYNNLARNQYEQAKYTQAEQGFHKALAIRRKVLGENHPATALSHDMLASNLQAQGMYRQAEEGFRKALAIRRKVLGEDHPLTAISHGNLALNLDYQGKYTEAEEGHLKALTITRKAAGEEHPSTAIAYNNLGHNQFAQGKYDQAEKGLLKALAIYRKFLGEDHPLTAQAYNNLAVTQDAQARYTPAEENFHKALTIRCKLLGENHPDTAQSYNNLARNQYEQGKYTDAEQGYRKALAIRRKVFGDDHPDTALSHDMLASNLRAQGKYMQADIGYRRALAIRRKVLGDDHPITSISYSNLSLNQNALGNYAEAEESIRKALAICRKVHGENHPDTAICYNNLASNLEDQGKYIQADEGYRKALAIDLKVSGENHPVTATTYTNLGSSLSSLGKHGDADDYFRKGLAIRRKVLGEEHPDTAISYSWLGWSLNARGEYTEAEDYWQMAAGSLERARYRMAPTGLDRAAKTSQLSPLPRLAAVLARNGKPAAAWQRFEQSLGRGTWDDLATRLRRSQAERSRQDQLIARLKRLDQLVERTLSVRKPSAAQVQQREELLTQQRQAQDNLNAFMSSLEKRHGLVAGQVFDRATIQAALPADAAFIAWIDITGEARAKDPNGEHWAVLLRSAGDPVFVSLPRTGAGDSWNDADRRLPAELYAALQSDRGTWQPLAQRLRKQRLAPLAKRLAAVNGLPAVRHLIVLPSPALAGLPVEVFADGYTVSYALSGTMVAHLRRQAPPKANGLLALGDPVFDLPALAAVEPPLPPGGVLLTVVTPGSNAARSGLRPNDVLLRYADKELATSADLQAATASPGMESVSVRVWRDGKTFTRQVQPGKLGVVLASDPAPKALAELRRLDRRLAARGGDEDNWQQLPGTRAEVEALRRLFGDKPSPRLLFDSDASEQRLHDLATKRQLGQFRYLHLATHGEVDNRLPLRSAVILSRDHLPDPGKQLDADLPIFDGRLTAEKVLRDWHLDSDLVTLSACQSALGKYEGGEGFVGFAQALILSGSRAVCLSLWKVDDTATALLMERFYQNLLGQRDGLKAPLPKGLALAEAKAWLRQLPREEAVQRMAQLSKGVARGKGRKMQPLLPGIPTAGAEKVNDRPYAHPYYWAAFVLIGDER